MRRRSGRRRRLRDHRADGDVLHRRGSVLRQIGDRGTIQDRRTARGAAEFRLPLDVAGVGAGNARPGSLRERRRPIAPGLIRPHRVPCAREEGHAGVAAGLGNPAQAPPAGHRRRVVYGRFEHAARCGIRRQPVNLPSVSGSRQQPRRAIEQPRSLAFVGLGQQRHLAIRRQPVDPAARIGRKDKLTTRSRQVVHILVLGTPQSLHGVVQPDFVNRRFLDPGEIGDRRELGRYLRICPTRDLSARIGLGLDVESGLGILLRYGNRRRCSRHLPAARGRLASGGSRQRPPHTRTALGRGIDGAVGRRQDGADLGKSGVVEYEGPVSGLDAVDNPVRLTPCQHTPLRVHGQASHVRLSGLVVGVSLARGVHPEHSPLVAGSGVQRAILGEGQRPDVSDIRCEELGGLALFDPVDLAVGGRGGVQDAAGAEGQREHLRFVRRPKRGRLPGLVDLKHLPPVPGSRIDGPVGSLHDAPDHRLIRSQKRVEPRRQRHAALPAERHSGEAATDEIPVVVHLPGDRAGGIGSRGQQEQREWDEPPFH